MPLHGPMPPVLLVANSARYLAQSARTAGLPSLVVDAFADLDTRSAATLWRQAEAVTPQALASAARELDHDLARTCSHWVYGAGFEAAPDLLHGLAGSAHLCGNPPEVLCLVGRPESWFALLERLGIDHPETRMGPPADPHGWLFKPAGGCGGIGVRPLSAVSRADSADARGCYQRWINGPFVSLLFAADGRAVRVLGFNHLFASDPRAGDFRYAGAISTAQPVEPMRRTMLEATRRLTSALGLRGINGLDFVLTPGGALLLELNARPPATLELYEDSLPRGGLRTHLDACAGELPATPKAGLVRGHQILYARRDLLVPELDWPEWCCDRPSPGSRIPAAAPLCSVRADGAYLDQVEQRLRTRAGQIQHLIETHAGGVA